MARMTRQLADRPDLDQVAWPAGGGRDRQHIPAGGLLSALLPDGGDRLRLRACPDMAEAGPVLDRAQDAVVTGGLAIGSRADLAPVEDGRPPDVIPAPAHEG